MIWYITVPYYMIHVQNFVSYDTSSFLWYNILSHDTVYYYWQNHDTLTFHDTISCHDAKLNQMVQYCDTISYDNQTWNCITKTLFIVAYIIRHNVYIKRQYCTDHDTILYCIVVYK